MTGAWAFLFLTLAAPPAQGPAAAENDGSRILIFLAENRPVIARLRITSAGRPFEASWIDSVKAIHASLDKNGDGILTTKEADPAILTALVRLAVGAAEIPPFSELDTEPKDGRISVDELAEALRPILGPFRLQVARQSVGRTDALFEQLDRDKDSALTRPELAAIAGSLRPLDLDDDAMISARELEPVDRAAISSMMADTAERQAANTSGPSVVELVADESTLRPARMLLKRYDKGRGDVPGRPDGRLSSSEFAIESAGFAAADTNGDDMLDVDELRKMLGRPPMDFTLEANFSQEVAGLASVKPAADGPLSRGVRNRQLAAGEVEFTLGQVELDFDIEDGQASSEQARRIASQQFKVADVNKNGYLEGKELTAIDAQGAPLAGLSGIIDRDGDGKLYLKELTAFVDRQIAASRSRLVVTTADHGRAIFGILDLDGDRRLSAREVMRTVERVMSWDGDHDGRVSADEVPYHLQVSIARGGLPGLTGESVANPAARSSPASRASALVAGPDWFVKMDRNHDGDGSRREFLGPRDQFDRMDRDDDGLIDAIEAKAGVTAKAGSRP